MERLENIMFKAEMEKSVRGILYTARDIWNRIGCMDDVVNLVRSAKMICAMYDLEMLEDVQIIENMMIKEWKEYKADEAELELKKRFSIGFTEEESGCSGNYCEGLQWKEILINGKYFGCPKYGRK